MSDEENELVSRISGIVSTFLNELSDRRTLSNMAAKLNEHGIACDLGDFKHHALSYNQTAVEVIVFKGVDLRLILHKGEMSMVSAQDIGKVYKA